MRLLIFTQKVDSADGTLGFFCGWIVEFSKIFESVSVICLEKGKFNLPKNVTVYSLGKESGISRFGYLKNFYHYLFLIRGSYDCVFIHMNQEYALLGGLYWKLKGIPVYLWRNHPKGSVVTHIAIMLSTKVFCTSTESFTAQFAKTSIMPVGTDTNLFRPISGIVRKKYSVCMIGRVSPIKHIELALQAVNILILSGIQISFSIIGSPTGKDLNYYDALKKYVTLNNLSNAVHFTNAVAPDRLPEIYSSHEVCLNLTESGSFDKTIVEASSCGAIPLVSNKSLANLLPEVCITGSSPEAVAGSIRRLFDPHEQLLVQQRLQSFVESQSLRALTKRLQVVMNK